MRLHVLALGLFVAGAVFAAANRPDFSGTWNIDPAHSESSHQDVPVQSSSMTIRTAGDMLTVETSRLDVGAATPFHETLQFRLDGSETVSTGDGGATVTGKARWNGPKLVLETVRNINDSTVTTLYVHTLGANGRTMTVDKTLTVQHGYMGRSAPTTGHGVDVFVRASK